jgi:hypothetical protein
MRVYGRLVLILITLFLTTAINLLGVVPRSANAIDILGY